MAKRVSHTRKESRLAVFRVLLDIASAKNDGRKYSVAAICRAYHVGVIIKPILDSLNWDTFPSYDDAVTVLEASNKYKRAHDGNLLRAIAEGRKEARKVTDDERLKAAQIEKEMAKRHTSFKPDTSLLFPRTAMLVEAIAIVQEHGYIVSRPL